MRARSAPLQLATLEQAAETGWPAAHDAGPPASTPAGLIHLLRRSRTATAAGGAGAVVLAFALAPMLARHSPYAVDVRRGLAPPSPSFPLGTDETGRDVFSRLLYGGRISIGAAVVATAFIAVIGVSFGMLAGSASRRSCWPWPSPACSGAACATW
ncbi:MAG: hypothetical protein LC792_16200 [Actinobacteria bacterium]|nr:hypothetical protein [Actinomycetota bacterium]